MTLNFFRARKIAYGLQLAEEWMYLINDILEEIDMEKETEKKTTHTSPEGVHCATCKYFAGVRGSISGNCRRYPPTGYIFPPVEENQWCGEYTAR